MNGHARDQVIRERAYHIWETHGRVSGKDLDHWLQAEREVSTTLAASKAAAPKPETTMAGAAATIATLAAPAATKAAPALAAIKAAPEPAKPAAKRKKATKTAAKTPAKPRSKKKS